MALALEVCVDNDESLVAALRGGATRVELCSALAVGGLTPSAGFAKRAVALVRGTATVVVAMVRPRAGADFCFSDAELATMLDDMELLKSIGVDGFVVGVLRSDGAIDEDKARLCCSLVILALTPTGHTIRHDCSFALLRRSTAPFIARLMCAPRRPALTTPCWRWRARAAGTCSAPAAPSRPYWALPRWRTCAHLQMHAVCRSLRGPVSTCNAPATCCARVRMCVILACPCVTASLMSAPQLYGLHGSLSTWRTVCGGEAANARMGEADEMRVRVCDEAQVRELVQLLQQSRRQ